MSLLRNNKYTDYFCFFVNENQYNLETLGININELEEMNNIELKDLWNSYLKVKNNFNEEEEYEEDLTEEYYDEDEEYSSSEQEDIYDAYLDDYY
jgi:hypothetical protein